MTTYLKATAIGILVGLLAAVLWISGNVFLPELIWRLRDAGGIGAESVGSGSTLLIAFIGFLTGFLWTVRRTRRSPTD